MINLMMVIHAPHNFAFSMCTKHFPILFSRLDNEYLLQHVKLMIRPILVRTYHKHKICIVLKIRTPTNTTVMHRELRVSINYVKQIEVSVL